MVRIRPERYSPGTASKLHARSAGPFKVLRKVRGNAYVIEIPSTWGISSTFNVSDLVGYRSPSSHLEAETFHSPSNEREFAATIPPSIQPDWHETVEDILEEVINHAGGDVVRKFLVRWQGRTSADDTWINEDDLRRLRPDLWYEFSFQDFNSTEPSSFHPGRIDGDITPSTTDETVETAPSTKDMVEANMKTTSTENVAPRRVQPKRNAAAKSKDPEFRYSG